MQLIVAVAGLLVIADALPGIRVSMARSKQKVSMAAVSRAATALERYAASHGTYPRLDDVGPLASIAPLLGAQIETNDDWGHPILYQGARTMVLLRATMRDGVNDGQTAPKATRSFDDDIVYVHGVFTRAPEGICAGDGERDYWDAKKYGECAECHPRRVHRAVTK